MYSLIQVREKVKKAIHLLYKNNDFLIKENINERSIAHKLAEYLQLEFPHYHVDCEYNRMLGSDGEIIIKKLHEIGIKIKPVQSNDTEGTTVYPDIIIHKRGDNSDNLLVIEIKKKNNDVDNDKDKYDKNKIKAYRSELKYNFGLFCQIRKDIKSTLKQLNIDSNWYINKI